MKTEETNNKEELQHKDISYNGSGKEKNTGGRSYLGAMIAILVVLVAGVFGFFIYHSHSTQQLSQVENQKQELSLQLSQRDSLVNDWMEAFNQIEGDLKTIKQKENLLNTQSSDREISKDQKQNILEDIKYINTLMDHNKKRIASLSYQLRKSGLKLKGLQDRIDTLSASLQQRNNEIASLKMDLVNKDFEVGQLNQRMDGLQAKLDSQDTKIDHQMNELNKAYIAYGTYKDLKDKGLLTKEGGFLGIGRKEELKNNFSDSLFKQINITETTTIPVNSKNAKLITDHPADSYKMVRENDKIAYIQIENPDEFWKISKYAVVEIK